MKKFLFLSFSVAAMPLAVLAQNLNITVPDDEFAYASLFAGNFSLLLSLVIGAIATFLVFRAAKKLGGGLFGSVLNFIDVGMLFIVLGTLATVINPSTTNLWLNITSTAFFALGYIFMVLGANKLLKGIMST